MSTESDRHSSSEGSALCPKCLLANAPADAFCAECGAPIGMVATIDPMQHIYAEGFAYRSAVDGPPRFIILLGMWLLFGPVALAAPFVLWNASSVGLPQAAFSGCLAIVSVVILYRTTRNYLVKSRSVDEPGA